MTDKIYLLHETDVAAALKSERHDKRMSLRDVASETGISASTISRIENGHVEEASFASILSLCNCYGLTVEELLLVEFDDGHDDLRHDIAQNGEARNLLIDLILVLAKGHPELAHVIVPEDIVKRAENIEVWPGESLSVRE
jgi:transcriptional regulator with XRE-family HTH domain